MKILKQQVGLLLTRTTGICWQIFSSFIYVSIVPVLAAENAEIHFFYKSVNLDFFFFFFLGFQTNVLLPSITKIMWSQSDFFISGWFLMSVMLILFWLFYPIIISIQEKIKRIQQIRMEKELRAQQILEVQNLMQQHLRLSRTFLDRSSPTVYSVLIFLKLITEQQHALEGVASS